MSQQYETNLRGTLGKNERREKDTHPEYTGKCEIDGKMFWISAWVKEGQGRKFFSLAFKPHEQAQQAPAKNQQAQTEDMGDIPF